MGLAPEEVFTPRTGKINEAMYVTRSAHEQDLRDALKGDRHIVIFGDSGCGKSWLYKRLFRTEGVHFEIANLANAVRIGSIQGEIRNVLERTRPLTLSETEDQKKAGGGVPGVASAELTNKRVYKIGAKEPYEAALEFIRDEAGRKPGVLVLDNLEMIFDSSKLMEELASLIILADDERYSQYNVKLLLVGVPAGIREYFNRLPNRGTVANRLVELPEVYRMSKLEAENLVLRGFEEQLKYPIRDSQRTAILSHICWVTHRIPQRLQEYCLELARLARRTSEVYEALLPQADKEWLKDSISDAYSRVEALMNERETKIGRRNQILFALGKTNAEEFRPAVIEEIVRTEFSVSAEGKTLNISGMLAELPILRRSPKGDGFVFSDPKYRLCIRTMLKKSQGGDSVEKVDIADLRGLLS